MEWWTLFSRVRKVVFALIAITSLTWAIGMSYCLSREWNEFSVLQRSIVLALICVNGVTSLLLYLMIVVVFRPWKELLRILFLLAVHIGTVVPFTLFNLRSSCDIFNNLLTCEIVDLTFLATAWAITGLLLGYTIYLCIMSRVPRPFPLITPIDLLTGSTSSLTRKSSTASVDSKSGLLTHANILPTVRPASLTSVYSYHSENSVSTRTIPKRLFVVNPEVRSPSSYTSTATQREHQIRPGESYGAMGSPGRPPPRSRSRFSGSTIASVQSQNAPPPTIRSPVQSFVGALSRRISTRALASHKQERNKSLSRRPTISRPMLLDSNPFREPLSRHGTPETALSSRSFVTAPANVNVRQLPTYIPFSQAQAYGNYIGPFSYPTLPPGIPPQLQPGAGASAESGKRTALFVPADAMSTSMNMTANVNGIPAHMLGPHISYAGSPATPSRVHTATPSSASIHSVVPSVHCIDEYGYPIAHTETTRSPPQAHICTASDPIWRPYSAGARMTGMYDNAELPNPYNRGAEIRRYGSVPHVRGAFGYGLGAPYGGVAYYTAGYTGHGARVHEHGIARGLAAANDPSWREMVMRAAASQ